MKCFICLFLFFNLIVQAQDIDPLKTERDQLIQKKDKNTKWKNEQLDLNKVSEENISKSKAELETLDDLIINNPKYIKQVTDESEAALKSLPTIKRMLSKKAAFYRCITNNLAVQGIADISSCKILHAAHFTPEDEKQISGWVKLVTLAPSINKIKRDQVLRSISEKEDTIKKANRLLEYAAAEDERLISSEKVLKQKENDQDVIRSNLNYVQCDANTPDISLEEKEPYPGAKFQGPFFGVSRDNQDGLGTCYANTAKNLLVGASQGDSVASFLDLALLYKNSDEALRRDGLDGGSSCEVLKRVNEKGFCPQSYAPFETGSKNLYTDGLMGANGTIWDQSALVEKLKDFLSGKEIFQKNDKNFSDKTLKHASTIIQTIKNKPKLKLPLPVLRFQVLSDYKLRETYFWSVKKTSDVSEDVFMNDYRANYKNFYPLYLKAVVEGKNSDQIFSIFKDSMKEFIEKYKIEDKLGEWKNSYLNDAKTDLDDPNLATSINDSIIFMKEISDENSFSKEDYLTKCTSQIIEVSTFLSGLDPLIKFLESNGVNSNVLLDKNGNFLAANDLMQLVVAPACLNTEARKKLDFKILCNSGYDIIAKIQKSNKSVEEQKKLLRERIVASLIQGYPLGNTFRKHINTIVGMKFDKDSNSCQYKIRESQTGTSAWHSETEIFNSIEALTEVRKE